MGCCVFFCLPYACNRAFFGLNFVYVTYFCGFRKFPCAIRWLIPFLPVHSHMEVVNKIGDFHEFTEDRGDFYLCFGPNKSNQAFKCRYVISYQTQCSEHILSPNKT